jgi:dTDP-glucose 4,6-dehydratase
MTKVVYVTGCFGLIGSHITRACLEKGWYVKGVDSLTYAANEDLIEEFCFYDKFSLVKDDINNLKFLYECDYIINTAAETHVGNSIANSDKFVSSNINGVHNLLELLRNYRQETIKVPILLHFSTDEVYGDIEDGTHNEKDLLKPSNPYSATKAAADQLILAWGRTYKIPYVIVRPTNNYGVGQYVEKLIPKACKYLSLNRKIPLHNGGSPIRNWLHAADTAQAVITIVESGVQNEIFNIAGGYEQSNLSTVEKVIHNYTGLSTFDINEYIDTDYSRPGQDVRYALDDSKLRSLGWEPKKQFDSEIKEIVQYYKSKFIW